MLRAIPNYRANRRIVDLSAKLRMAYWNADLGCHRRAAVDEAWPKLDHSKVSVIFFDIDGLNAANDRYGYAGVNKRIAAVWDALRLYIRASDVSGLIQGGDEFIIVAPHADAVGLAVRVQKLLYFVGLSASRAIVYAQADLSAVLAQANDAVKQARRAGGESSARGIGERGIYVDMREGL
jgi:diguanylate cyclase (GGDEF)-like protein